MKKVVGIFMMMVLVFVIITANAEQHYIFDDVYGFWKELHSDIMKIYEDYYIGNDQEFIYDGYYYIAGYELGFGEDTKGMTYKELESHIEEVYKEHGVDHTKCSIVQIGKGNTMNVLFVEINTMTNLREIEDYADLERLDFDDGSDVYGSRLVFYEHVY